MQLNQIHPLKDYKEFTGHLKKVYEAAGRKAAEEEFERFKQNCGCMGTQLVARGTDF